jgi:hypothetical protein
MRADVARDVLLWVGGLLLALAALIFAAFAWRRLDDGGRALMLVAATIVAGAIAAWLRRRLKATAEVFAALALVMLAIDWLALRTAGVGRGLDLPTWWSIGSAAIAIIAFAAGNWFGSARVLMAMGALVSGTLAVFASAGDSEVAGAIGFATLATASVAGSAALRTKTWASASALLGAGAATSLFFAAGAVFVGVADHGDPTVALALAAASCACAPALAAVFVKQEMTRDLLVGGATVAVLAGVAIGLWVEVEAPWLGAAIAAAATAVIVVGLFAPRVVRTGATNGAWVVLLLAATTALAVAGTAVFEPLTIAEDAWQRGVDTPAGEMLRSRGYDERDAHAALVVVLLITGASSIVVARRRRTATSVHVIAAVAAAAVVSLAPFAFDMTLGVAAAVTVAAVCSGVVASGELARRAAPTGWIAAGAAAIVALPAAGWALTSETTTLVAVGGVLAASAVATWRAPTQTLGRAGFAALAAAAFAALAAAGALAAGASEDQAGVAVACAAGAVLVAATLWPREAVDGIAAEVAGIVAVLAGLSFAWSGDIERAVALTALVPCLAVPGSRADRRGYLVAASTVAVFAAWAWLAAASVELIEAYSLPAALGAVAAGEIHRRQRPASTSWLTYAPAIVIAFGPTLAIAVAETGLIRPAVLAVAATAACWAGARFRLQAPLVLGALTVVVLGVDTLAPVAAKLPRWLTVALAGALLVWLGATIDRRLTQLRTARDRFAALEEPRSVT